MKHGTHATYRRGCHCGRCRAGAARYERSRRSGVHVFVDSAETRDHIRFLLRRSMTLQGIAAASGVSFCSVRALSSGERARCYPETTNRLLAITPSDTPAGHSMQSARVTPLLNAMYAAGITQAEVCRFLGLRSHWVHFARRPLVTTKTWRRVVTLYELLARQGIVPASVLEEVS